MSHQDPIRTAADNVIQRELRRTRQAARRQQEEQEEQDAQYQTDYTTDEDLPAPYHLQDPDFSPSPQGPRLHSDAIPIPSKVTKPLLNVPYLLTERVADPDWTKSIHDIATGRKQDGEEHHDTTKHGIRQMSMEKRTLDVDENFSVYTKKTITMPSDQDFDSETKIRVVRQRVSTEHTKRFDYAPRFDGMGVIEHTSIVTTKTIYTTRELFECAVCKRLLDRADVLKYCHCISSRACADCITRSKMHGYGQDCPTCHKPYVYKQ